MKKTEILDDISSEVVNATTKHPRWPDDPLHAIAVIGEEFGELTQAVLQCVYEPDKSDIEDVYNEAVQTAAMLVRFLMSLDEYEFERSMQHKQ